MDLVTAPQPSLRIVSHLREGELAYPVTDTRCLPMIEPGEVAVIDLGDRELEEGGMYLRRFHNGNGEQCIAVWVAFPNTIGRPSDPDRGPTWLLGKPCRPKHVKSYRDFAAALVDGPFFSDRIAPQIVGRVIGILSGCEARQEPKPTPVAYGPRNAVLTPL